MSCQLLVGDALTVLKTLESGSVQCCVTSPAYYKLRSYLPDNRPDKHLEMGNESSPDAFIAQLVGVFREVKRVLRNNGTLWINIADSFQDKQLLMMPARLALALQADNWWLRQDIIWHKPAPMPSSATDRCTNSHEHLFMLAKSARYFYNAKAIEEPAVKGAAGSTFTNGKTGVNGPGRVSQGEREDGNTRNKRDVWTIAGANYVGAHYAVMPPKLVEPCVLAGSREGDTVLDPFSGSSTAGMVALSHGRSFIGIDLDERNLELARQRIGPMLLDEPTATTLIRPVAGATGNRTPAGFNARWTEKERGVA